MITLTLQEREMMSSDVTAPRGARPSPWAPRFQAKAAAAVAERMDIRSRGLRGMMMDVLNQERSALQTELRAQAPKKTGTFARGIRGLVYEDVGGQLKLEMISGGGHAYLLPFIVGGTRPHIIPRGGSAEMMAKGYPLRFYWANGPKGPGVYFFWHVHHPGTKPNDFIGRALQVRYPHMQRAFRKGMMEIASMARYSGGAAAPAQE